MAKGIASIAIVALLTSSAAVWACDKNERSAGVAKGNSSLRNNGLARNKNNNINNVNNEIANQKLAALQQKVNDAQRVVADAVAVSSKAEGNFNSTWTRIKS